MYAMLIKMPLPQGLVNCLNTCLCLRTISNFVTKSYCMRFETTLWLLGWTNGQNNLQRLSFTARSPRGYSSEDTFTFVLDFSEQSMSHRHEHWFLVHEVLCHDSAGQNKNMFQNWRVRLAWSCVRCRGWWSSKHVCAHIMFKWTWSPRSGKRPASQSTCLSALTPFPSLMRGLTTLLPPIFFHI